MVVELRSCMKNKEYVVDLKYDLRGHLYLICSPLNLRFGERRVNPYRLDSPKNECGQLRSLLPRVDSLRSWSWTTMERTQ